MKTKAQIGTGQGSLRGVEFLVDTGSFYTFLSPKLADHLGITLPVTSEVVLADSRRVEVSMGAAYLRLMDREGGVLVASMGVPLPLLGASALQALGLKVNPVDETVEYYLPFGPAAL
ncbi:MAG: aspartyl protease family protein [Dehalococcoidia bacterium]|nr:aspartyl protease family protein [Dehalococcoidia bacterium]